MMTSTNPQIQISIDLDTFLSGVPLPALPTSAIRLLELSRNLENGPSEYAKPIEADESLTSQVLRFVNSSYFGFAQKISNVKQAITLVGTATIKNFVLWTAIFSATPDPKCGPFDLRSLQHDSLRRGLFARVLAKWISASNPEEAFTVGLLQDMAIPLIAKELPVEYAQFLEQREGGSVRLSNLERQAFGWTHADAASRLFQIWNLPEHFADLVQCHIGVKQTSDILDLDQGQQAVAMSSLLPASCDRIWYQYDLFEQCYESLGLEQEPELLLAKIDREYGNMAAVLGMRSNGTSLANLYQQARDQRALIESVPTEIGTT
ncbi:MAG: HDOD domain-containing protein [Pirellulales bacterium]